MNVMAMRLGRLYRCTPAELSLEEAVASIGVPYRVQFPGYLYGSRYFPDFVLPTLRLVIEVDDPSHERLEKMEEDEERTLELEAKFGWRVVRCTNEEALEDPHGTVRRLLRDAGMLPLPHNQPSLAAALPQPQKCPQKTRRAAKSAQLRRRRRERRRKD